nr:hypothetical protein [uncultured Rhodoferax sp.]
MSLHPPLLCNSGVLHETSEATAASSVQFGQQGKNLSLYGVDRNFAYALTGDMDRPALMAVSEADCAQLPR